MKKQYKKILSGVMSAVMTLTAVPASVLPAYGEEMYAANVVYFENFNYPDEVGRTDFLPEGWTMAGSMPSVAAIREDGGDYYYEVSRQATPSEPVRSVKATASDTEPAEKATVSNSQKKSNSQKSSYIGKVFREDLSETYIFSYDLCYTEGGDVDLFMYENRLNAGKLAVRAGIKNGNMYAFDGSTQKTLVENVAELGWIHISYIIDNTSKEYEVIFTKRDGSELYRSGSLTYHQADGKVGAFSIKCNTGAAVYIDNMKLEKQEAEPEYPMTDFYYEDFTYPEALDNDTFVPADWSVVGAAPSLTAVRTDADNYYYEIGRPGDSGSSYIGKKFTMTLPDQYVVSLDVKYTNAANVNLFMYDNGLNSGNLAVRTGITKNSDGGSLFAFDGGTNKVLLKNMESLDWLNLSYVIDNASKSYEVVLADLEGNEIYRSGKLSFHKSAAGKAGAFAFNCSPDSEIMIDNFRIYGEDKPYKPSPVEALPEKTGKVNIEDNGTEYVLSNDYTKMVIKKYDATVTSMIRYISDHSELEDGGYEVLGGGTGYYLLNYVLDGSRLQCAVKNAEGQIAEQRDDYCEVVLTLDDAEQCPVALEFHFVLEADTEGVYMYARSRRATGVEGKVEIEQSRYSFRVDSRMYGYSGVADRELAAFPEFEDYRDRVFDATYILEDGSIYTKYNNNSYQYNSFVCGAYGEELGFSLITPSREWAGGGYTKQDIDVHDSGSNTTRLVNWHFATSHYGTGWAEATDDWEKLYGPVLWYANYGNSKEEIRQEAIEKTEKEIGKWPYTWVEDEGYSAEKRSSVTGTFAVKNGEIVESDNDISPEGTCGWAVLSDSRCESWQKDNNYYEYYAPIQDDGSFSITGIRPGTYKININVNGIIGEYEQDNIMIGENTTVDLGDILWNDPVYGETLWTIGIPDRTAEEYAGGRPYRIWGSHLMFDRLFPDGIAYKVGESDYTKDWYVVHMASQTAGMLEHNDGSFYLDEEGVVKYDASLGTPITVDDERWKGDQATKWNIFFDQDKTYESGTATLVVAIAGGRAATLVVRVNGVLVTDVINITEAGGGYPRSAVLDQYVTLPIRFDASLLVKGENVITLSHERPSYAAGQTAIDEMKAYKSIMYDAIRLDVDAKPASEKTLTHIKLTELPDRLYYDMGDEFDSSGMVLEKVFDDNTTELLNIEECSITGFDSTHAGICLVTVSYKEYSVSLEVTINKKSNADTSESSSSSTDDYYGWIQDGNGWKYFNSTGSYIRNEWAELGGKWYYFAENGYMKNGWVLLREKWYWLNPGSGEMVADDWVFYQGKWYYLGSDGAMVTGWIEYKGDWYYLTADDGDVCGSMLTDSKTPDGYYVDSEGKWMAPDRPSISFTSY